MSMNKYNKLAMEKIKELNLKRRIFDEALFLLCSVKHSYCRPWRVGSSVFQEKKNVV